MAHALHDERYGVASTSWQSSSTLKARNEQRAINGRIEFVDQISWLALAVERDGAETSAGQFAKPSLGGSQGGGIGRIELVSCIAASIHHDLNAHLALRLVCKRLGNDEQIKEKFRQHSGMRVAASKRPSQ